MHHVVMASITIRGVPDDVREELDSRAKATGLSLEQSLRTWLMALAARGAGVSVQDVLDACDADRR